MALMGWNGAAVTGSALSWKQFIYNLTFVIVFSLPFCAPGYTQAVLASALTVGIVAKCLCSISGPWSSVLLTHGHLSVSSEDGERLLYCWSCCWMQL